MMAGKISPYISVIVLNYNGKQLLDDCFKSISKTNYPNDRFEVVMVDNGSTDGSAGYVQENYPYVEIISVYPNKGVVGGNNIGVKTVLKNKNVDYVVLLNNDVTVDKDWLIEMVKVAEGDRTIGVCGPTVLNTDKTVQSLGGNIDLLGAPHLLTARKNNKFSQTFFISSCCILIKREAIDKLDHFLDSRHFAYYDEIDLCWRIRLNGYKIVCVYPAKIIHKGSATTKRSGMYIMSHYRNKILTFKKNLRSPLREIFLLPMFFSTLVMAMYWSARGLWYGGADILKYFFVQNKTTKVLDTVSLKKQLAMFRA